MKRRAGYVAVGLAGGVVGTILAEWAAVVALVLRRMWR
jgi:hypothetical protein